MQHHFCPAPRPYCRTNKQKETGKTALFAEISRLSSTACTSSCHQNCTAMNTRPRTHKIRPMRSSTLLQNATRGQDLHLLNNLSTPVPVLSHLLPATPAGEASGRPGTETEATLKRIEERERNGRNESRADANFARSKTMHQIEPLPHHALEHRFSRHPIIASVQKNIQHATNYGILCCKFGAPTTGRCKIASRCAKRKSPT